MKWIDTCRSAWKTVVNTTINAAISTLESLGSLACVAGGVAFSLSYEMDETVTGSYYASGNITGNVTFHGVAPKFDNYTFNTTVPFTHYLQQDGGLTYSLTELVLPETVRTTSAILSASGTALRLLGANLRTWQQGRYDSQFLEERFRVKAIGPTAREYLYANAQSLSSSLSFMTMGSAVSAAAIQWSGLLNYKPKITFPHSSDLHITSEHDTGPVTNEQIPLQYDLAPQNESIDLPIIHVPVEVDVQVAAQAVANTTYGGGVFFQSQSKGDFPVEAPAIIGASAYLAGNFFAVKARRLRSERLIEAERQGYDLIGAASCQ
jgi:hypothetical protein